MRRSQIRVQYGRRLRSAPFFSQRLECANCKQNCKPTAQYRTALVSQAVSACLNLGLCRVTTRLPPFSTISNLCSHFDRNWRPDFKPILPCLSYTHKEGRRLKRAVEESIMAEEHAKAITAVRAKLVEQRRDLVTDLGKTAKRRTKGSLIKLIAIQSAIDTLDKAYQDEKEDMVG